MVGVSPKTNAVLFVVKNLLAAFARKPRRLSGRPWLLELTVTKLSGNHGSS